jgi:hypothetical protein
MNAAEELTQIIMSPESFDGGPVSCGPNPVYAARTADAIIAAGYRKVELGEVAARFVGEELRRKGWVLPRTITTAEELDALPVGSVVLCRGRAFQHYPAYPAPFDEYQKWKCADGGFVRSTKDGSQILPATVLHEPEAQK